MVVRLFCHGKTYSLINGVRIVKSLVTVPLEGTLIVVILNAFLPVLKRLRYVDGEQEGLQLRKRDILFVVGLTLFSTALILFWFFFLKDFVADHNIKWF